MRRDPARGRLALLGLVSLLALIQASMIARAVTPAQDVVRVVAIAQAIELEGARHVWQQESGPPLFPTAVALMHRGLAMVLGEVPGLWPRSAQLVAAMALVAGLLPFYGLARYWVGRRAAFWAGLAYCALPELIRLGGDGLADSLHLTLLLTACFSLVQAGRPVTTTAGGDTQRRIGWSLLAGLLLGMAILSDRQGWLALVASLAAVTSVSLSAVIRRRHAGFSPLVELRCWRPRLATQMDRLVVGRARRSSGQQPSRGELRRPMAGEAELREAAPITAWQVVLFSGGVCGALLGFLAVCSPASGPQALARLTGRYDPDRWAVLNPPHTTDVPAALKGGRPAGPSVERGGVPAKETEFTSRRRGLVAAAAEWLDETADAAQYWIGGLIIGGLVLARRSRSRWPCYGVAFFATWSLGTVAHCATSGYLATRHMLPPVVLLLPWAGLCVSRLARKAAEQTLPGAAPLPRLAYVAIAVAVFGPCWLRAAEPLHQSRAAHRRAAEWLTSQRGRSAAVLDSRGFSALYTGRPTYRMQAASRASRDPALEFVVLEAHELHFGTRRARQLEQFLAEFGRPVVRFEHPRHPGLEDVVVYRRRAPADARLARR